MIKRIFRKLFRKQIVKNYHKFCPKDRAGYALLYYKTDPLVFKSLADDFSHTNHLEIIEMVKIFNKLGFWVDIIDRTIDIDKLILEDKYVIFLGIGAGNSGKYYYNIASMVPSAIKIFYALGPEPKLSNRLIEKRYGYFFERHPEAKMERRRVIDDMDMVKIMDHTDIIFSGGGSFSMNSYKGFNKEIFRFYCPISPSISMDISQFKNRSQKKFLYFGGNGNIVKGLDLVIEAFAGLGELELYICAPDWEKDFNAFYKRMLDRSKNIHFLGFIKVGGELFNRLTSLCGYVIFLSCSEGAANSAVVCMRRGLVPILTPESGIDHAEDSGYLIQNIRIQDLQTKIKQISESSKNEFMQKSVNSYFNSFQHTLFNFSEKFEKIIIKILIDNYGK